MTTLNCCACGAPLTISKRGAAAKFPCCSTPECKRIRTALYEAATYISKPPVTLTCSVCSTVFTRQRRGVQEPAFASCGEKACAQEAQNQRRREWRAAHPRVKAVRVVQPKAPKPPKPPKATGKPHRRTNHGVEARVKRDVDPQNKGGIGIQVREYFKDVRRPETVVSAILDNGLWKRTCTCPKCGRSKPTDGTCWQCSQGTLRTVFRRDEWPVAA